MSEPHECLCVLVHPNGARVECSGQAPGDGPFCKTCEDRHAHDQYLQTMRLLGLEITARPIKRELHDH